MVKHCTFCVNLALNIIQVVWIFLSWFTSQSTITNMADVRSYKNRFTTGSLEFNSEQLVQWGMLQRTMLQRTMLQRTNATTNDATASECYSERMLQRTNAKTNDATTNECYNERMLQRTVLSIKSGCYNGHRCYNERGGILSADVARACA